MYRRLFSLAKPDTKILVLGFIILMLLNVIMGTIVSAGFSFFDFNRENQLNSKSNYMIMPIEYHSNQIYSIVINEILANAVDEDTGEFVELYNYGDSPINVSGWFVKDPKDTNDKIKDYTGKFDWGSVGTIIPPYGYCLYVDSEYRGEYNHLLENSSKTDNMIMVTCDSDTTIGNGLTNSADSVTIESADGFSIRRSWSENAGEGASMGLVPDAGEPWIILSSTSPGFSNGRPPKVIINELMCNPKGNEASGEWVELYNADDYTLNISGWRLKDSDNNVLTFPILNLPKNCYLVVHTGSKSHENPVNDLETDLDNKDDLDFSDGTGHIYCNKTTSIWTNTGDCVNLSTSGGLCLDYIAYGNRSSISPPIWYQKWVGPNPEAEEDCTIALKPNGIFSDSAEDWYEIPFKNITEGWNNDHIYNLEIEPRIMSTLIDAGSTQQFNLTIKNNGTVDDYFIYSYTQPSQNWSWALSSESIFLKAKQYATVQLNITAPEKYGSNRETTIYITVKSERRSEYIQTHEFTFKIPSVELTLKWLRIESEKGDGDIIFEGEMPSLKGRVYNAGELTAGEFHVGFMVKSIENVTIMEKAIHYEQLKSKSSKYPQITWDTLGYTGNYTVTLTVDISHRPVESNIFDNILSKNVNVLPTSPGSDRRKVLLKEIYYDSLTSGEPDEYIVLYNPLNESLSISNWRLEDGEGIITFPEETFLEPEGILTVAGDGLEFNRVTGFLPDFELSDSHPNVPDMEITDYGFKLTNTGDEIMLRTEHRHLIDVIVYGNSDYAGEGWLGSAVRTVPEGNVLKRNHGSRFPKSTTALLDTNTSVDWHNFQIFCPGQSEFSVKSFQSRCNITAFVSPDSALEPLISVLKTANRTIDVASYVFTSTEITQELIKALKRKVTVRVLLSGALSDVSFESNDGIGAISTKEWLLVSELYSYGAEIQFMVSQPDQGIKSRYARINSKYMIIDNAKVVITTENFGTNGFPKDPLMGNRGYGLIIEDTDIAEYLTMLFEFDWNSSRPDSVSYDPQQPIFSNLGLEEQLNIIDVASELQDNTQWSEQLHTTEYDTISVYDDCVITPIIGPDNIFIQSSVIELIDSATSRISISLFMCTLNWTSDQAGYSGNNPLLTAAVDAAKRGVEVELLLNPQGFTPNLAFENDSCEENNKMEGGNIEVLRFINELASEFDLEDKLEARFAYLIELENYHGNCIIVDEQRVMISSFHWELEELCSDRELGIQVYNSEIAGYFQNIFARDWNFAPQVYRQYGKVVNTSQINYQNPMIITEFYYDTYTSTEPDEYFRLFNPSDTVIDLSGWFITDGEGIIWFPNNIIIDPGEQYILARSAFAFEMTFGFWPDFEYICNSNISIPNLKVVGGLFQLSNTGDEIIIMDPSGNIIDVIIYGKSKYDGFGWQGASITDVTEGRILKRNRLEPTNIFIDTDRREDWQTLREFYPRQSQLALKTFKVNLKNTNEPPLTLFVSPDSSYDTIYRELAGVRESVFINIYEFNHEGFAKLLCELAGNGVDVRILLEGDPVGGISNSGRGLADIMQKSGCSVRLLISDPERDINDRYTFNHAKYAVLDGSAVLIMSENWKMTGVPVDNTQGNRGTGVIIRNCAVAEYFTALFLEDSSIDNPDIIEYDKNDLKYGFTNIISNINQSGEGISEDDYGTDFHNSGNYLPRFTIKDIFGESKITPIISPDHSLLESGSIIEMLRSASESVYIEQLQCYRYWKNLDGNHPNIYLEEVMNAARRGCEVKILLDSAYIDYSYNENGNAQVVDYLNELAIAEELDSHMEARLIHLSDKTGRNELVKVHNKGIIVDGRTVYVGSMNWGSGGPIKNREVGVIIANADAARYYENVFLFDWNLTLNNLVDTSVSYSTNIVFSKTEKTLYCELALFNPNNTTNLSMDLILNHYPGGVRADSYALQASINRTHIDISPLGCERVGIALILSKQSSSDKNQSNSNGSSLRWNEYDDIYFLVEIRSSSMNMSSSLLWLEIYYEDTLEFPGQENTTKILRAEPWNLREVDARVVLAFVIMTMIMISLLRDVIQRRLR